ncbi:hypothetical protein DAPPUDRAFT_118346 [Daphnia pulex]|uniref:Uncharacterized protein n=1 Tax=Daphnia pulex TaxID=6669 RepID=E9HVH7_DAPPU|nr:hypothetical protein DAPPUDRAFT_118346 [Daphnia pulex]|eukprot:EFX64255.1 hypothetical protein DAPPUDRAFT_118346 [Daphnia pulex]
METLTGCRMEHLRHVILRWRTIHILHLQIIVDNHSDSNAATLNYPHPDASLADLQAFCNRRRNPTAATAYAPSLPTAKSSPGPTRCAEQEGTGIARDGSPEWRSSCNINGVSALSDFEDVTFDLLEKLENITFIEKCFRILVVFVGNLSNFQNHHPTYDFPVCNLLLEMGVVVSMRFGTGDRHQSRPLGLSNFDLDRTCLLLLRIARPITLIAINHYLDIIRCERYADLKQFV